MPSMPDFMANRQKDIGSSDWETPQRTIHSFMSIVSGTPHFSLHPHPHYREDETCCPVLIVYKFYLNRIQVF